MRRFILSLLLIVLLAAGISPAQAGTAHVYGIFFYSPTCPHCHEVLNNHWPAISDEFGDQLRILFVDTSTQGGSQFMQVTREAMSIEANGVPMLIIGNNVLVGSLQIPEQAPTIIRTGLLNGGIDVPPIPYAQDLFIDMFPDYAAAIFVANLPVYTPPIIFDIADDMQVLVPDMDAARQLVIGYDVGALENSAPQTYTTQVADDGIVELTDELVGQSFGEMVADYNVAAGNVEEALLSSDPANYIAIALLISLVASLGFVLFMAWQVITQHQQNLPNMLGGELGIWVIAPMLFMGIGLTLSLLQGSTEPLVSLMALVMLVVLLAALVISWNRQAINKLPRWFVPMILFVGVIAAGYLTYIESTETLAVCGMVGNCNAVQQSPYASIMGIPIGLIGIVGYILMAITWVISLYRPRANAVFLLLTTFGVAFTIYLTFLEPFVIRATCVWCLTSAVVMLLLLWLIAPDGLKALAPPQDRQRAEM